MFNACGGGEVCSYHVLFSKYPKILRGTLNYVNGVGYAIRSKYLAVDLFQLPVDLLSLLVFCLLHDV